MMIRTGNGLFLARLAIVTAAIATCVVQPAAATQPPVAWRAYASPEEAGFSKEALQSAREQAEKAGSATVFVVYRGNVLAAWGDVSRRFELHSVRKSLLSGLIGAYVGSGQFDGSKSLGELGIDDKAPLTATEKSATVLDMLKSCSGVYHPAAKEPADMKAERPPRGSHAPGTHFWYNNWDFNTLGVIFEKQTGVPVFEAFKTRIADPIGMEDFRVEDGYYQLEPSNSLHPAYGLPISARDLARYGVLFAQNGRWADKQVIPADWVAESTRSQTSFPDGAGYGYMWWVHPKGSLGKDTPLRTLDAFDKFSARGTGGQFLLVIPEAQFVFVHQADTANGRNVRGPAIWRIAETILAGKTADPPAAPKLTELSPLPFADAPPPPPVRQAVAVDPKLLEAYVGEYRKEPEYHVTVFTFQGRLFGTLHGQGEGELLPQSPTRFFVRAENVEMEFHKDEAGAVTHLEMNLHGKVEKLQRVK